jgi:hypothetical protein
LVRPKHSRQASGEARRAPLAVVQKNTQVIDAMVTSSAFLLSLR